MGKDAAIQKGLKGAIHPGEAPGHWGFTPQNFSKDSYLWGCENGRIMISFIASFKPGSGAFSKLIKAIEADGYRVAVPTPLGKMQLILAKWGFKPTNEYDTNMGETVEVWMR